MQKLQLQIYLT